MKYENQRPELADQVKALVQSANSVKTTPHGIKTVEPGEGLQLLSSEGAEIFWDWETANTWDTRIQEGQAAIAQAERDLAQARLDLDAGAARVDENRAILDALAPRVDAAESTVAEATKNLTTLEGTVGDVSAKAEASEQKALEALNRAGTAQAAADGKTTITRALEPRTTQKGGAIGDTHFTMSSMGGGGQVLRQQRWDGSTWQDEALSHQVISSVDLGKATVGELDGVRVKAGSITSDRLSVGPSENSITDAGFTNLQISANRVTRSGGAWVRGLAAADTTNYYQRQSFTGLARWHFYPLPGTSFDMSGMIPTSGDTPWRFRADVNSGGGTAQWGVYYINRDGSTVQALVGAPTAGGNARRTITADWTAPSTVMGMQPFIQFDSGTTVRTATVYGGAQARPKVGTVLIEDGAVTGDKIEGVTVAAQVVRSMTAEHKNLVVTESAILQHTTLLGTTVADQLNVRKLLRGRDAIFDGTVDVAQLNVTGAMSAEIVRAMDITARRGIFTEGLTAQDATLLGTTVAETINASTVAARIMTGGLLQTTTAAARGVKIDNAGIRAWDDTGRQTVQLDGKANYLTGTFATAEKEQRVEIKSGGSVAAADFYGSGNTVDHLGVWHQSDAGDSSASRIVSQNGMTRIRGNPGLVMWPYRGDFAFLGRWARNTDTVKMFWTVNYNGIPGGAWADLVYTYTTPFPTQYTDLVPILSVESRSGAECIAVVKTSTPEKITFRVVNKSTNATDVFYLRGITYNFNTVEYKNSNW